MWTRGVKVLYKDTVDPEDQIQIAGAKILKKLGVMGAAGRYWLQITK
jgi:hypothetical protein